MTIDIRYIETLQLEELKKTLKQILTENRDLNFRPFSDLTRETITVIRNNLRFDFSDLSSLKDIQNRNKKFRDAIQVFFSQSLLDKKFKSQNILNLFDIFLNLINKEIDSMKNNNFDFRNLNHLLDLYFEISREAYHLLDLIETSNKTTKTYFFRNKKISN